MSGPKGIAYQVVSAEELHRRATEAARSRVAARLAVVQGLRRSVRAEVVAAIPETRTHSFGSAELTQLTAMEAGLAAEEAAISLAREQERSARARAALASELDSLQIDLPELRFRSTAEARPKRAEPASQFTRRLQAVLDLAVGLDDSLRHDLQHLAGVVADPAAGSAKALSFLTEMEARVTVAAARQREQDRLVRRAHELAYSFADLLSSGTAEGAEAQTVVDGLTAQPGRPQLDAATRQLGELERRRAAAADRRFAVEQATAVLAEMGYTVDLQSSGAGGELIAMASTQAWPHHGLRLVFPAGRPGLHTLPVAFDETDARDDVAFEESSCGDVQRLREGLSRRGVPTDLTHHAKPGSLAVQKQARATAAPRPVVAKTRNRKR